MKGIVFDIQKFSLHDGPGIRTTVFFKGCNLRCIWCHNPESFRLDPQLSFQESKCSKCGECVKECLSGVHSIIDGKHRVDFKKCKACGSCVSACFNNALKIMGKEYTVEEVLREVEKDRKYYVESGGGVTLSGGEATVQFEFALELLKEAKQRDLHTCLETNGVIKEERIKELTQYVDMFLLDYKASDPDIHAKYTGARNNIIVNNLKILDLLGAAVILRCPIIPGINDAEEHFQEIARLSKEYTCIQYAEIMPYHSIGKDKWSQTGSDYSLYNVESVSKEKAEVWRQRIRDYGGNVR